jgi:hypothetical protein
MKTIIVFSFLIFLFCLPVYGQRFYLNAGAGFGTNEFFYNDPEKTIYGTGSLGYYLTKRFNVEVAFNNFSYPDKVGNIQYYYFAFNLIRMMPILKFKITKSFNAFYLKFGFVFSLDGKSLEVFTSQNEFPPYNINTETVKASGSSFNNGGGMVALGKDTRLFGNNSFGIYSLFIEITYMVGNWYANHISITETTIPVPDNSTALNDFSLHEYTTLSMQIGLKYSFGKK